MSDPAAECIDGALPYEEAARFLGVCKRTVELIAARGELDVVYEGTKPRVLRRQLIERLARQLEGSRAARAKLKGQ